MENYLDEGDLRSLEQLRNNNFNSSPVLFQGNLYANPIVTNNQTPSNVNGPQPTTDRKDKLGVVLELLIKLPLVTEIILHSDFASDKSYTTIML